MGGWSVCRATVFDGILVLSESSFHRCRLGRAGAPAKGETDGKLLARVSSTDFTRSSTPRGRFGRLLERALADIPRSRTSDINLATHRLDVARRAASRHANTAFALAFLSHRTASFTVTIASTGSVSSRGDSDRCCGVLDSAHAFRCLGKKK